MDEVMERTSVVVGGVEIPPSAIAAEVQNHPASDAESAWREAAEARRAGGRHRYCSGQENPEKMPSHPRGGSRFGRQPPKGRNAQV